MVIKQKSPSLPITSVETFGEFANHVLNKGKSVIPPLFSDLEVLSSAPDIANCLLKTFLLKTLILMTWVCCFPF